MIIINPYLRFVLPNSNMMFLIYNKSIFFSIKFLNNPTLDNIRRCKWALRKKEPNMKDRRNIRKENKRLQPRCTSVYLSQASTKDPCLLLRCILSQDPLPPSLVCPPLTAFLSHPCTCSISALLNHEDPRNELLFSADRSAHRTLFREKGSRGEGPEGGPVSNSFFWRLHFVRQREGKRKKKKKRKEKILAETAFLLRKVIVPWWRPIGKCSAREEDWALAGCWLSHNREKRNLERWKVEMGGGGWRGRSRRENRNGGRVGRFVGPILLDTIFG